jgi:hypothetical protein
MYIILTRSWRGRPVGTILEVEEKYYPYIAENKIGTIYEKKELKPTYENKEEKKPRTRRKKSTANTNDNAKDND